MYFVIALLFFRMIFPMIVYASVGVVILTRLNRLGWQKSLLVIALFLVTPFAFWELARVRADDRQVGIDALLSGMRSKKTEINIPDVLVLESRDVNLQRLTLSGCIKRVIVNMDVLNGNLTNKGPTWMDASPRTGDLLGPAALPGRYLRFADADRTTAKITNLPGIRHGPWELAKIDGSTTTILAFDYDEDEWKPSFPPILTSDGWMKEKIPSKRTHFYRVPQFINSALGECKG